MIPNWNSLANSGSLDSSKGWRGFRRHIFYIGEQTHGPTVVLHPPILSGMVGYAFLINRLRGSANLLGLQYPDRLSLFGSAFIEDLSRFFAKSISAVRIVAPLHFVGWSMGAYVAYECARCLSDVGITVDNVVLIDPNPTTVLLRDSIPRKPEPRDRFLWNSYLHMKFPDEVRQRVINKGNFWLLSERERLASIRRHAPVFLPPLAEFFRRKNIRKEFQFVKRSILGLSRYELGAYEGGCSIICCKQHRKVTERVWKKELIPNRRIIEVEGDHLSIMFDLSIEPTCRIVLGEEAWL